MKAKNRSVEIKKNYALPAREFRIAMIRLGGSLNGWCASRGVNTGYMYQILAGDKRGPRSMRLLQELRADTGL
jgi:hypothetical protein